MAESNYQKSIIKKSLERTRAIIDSFESELDHLNHDSEKNYRRTSLQSYKHAQEAILDVRGAVLLGEFPAHFRYFADLMEAKLNVAYRMAESHILNDQNVLEEVAA
ncbi:MAG: hypothetical protein KC506_00105 [Nanoarchaeota archaeon]|nr:hypothetical protein [Nanoarchaeota archaeon]